MAVKQIALVFALVALFNSSGVSAAGGFVRVTPILYENSYGRDYDGAGCDPFGSGCDHRFTFCMRLVGGSGCIQQYTSSVYANSYGVDFSSGITNPMTFNFANRYPGSFHLYVQVTDQDSSLSEGYYDDNVDEFGITRTMSPGSDSGRLAFYGSRSNSPTKLTLRFEVFCFQDFYGSSCTTHCAARDDEGGHFTCDSTGERICIDGWSDPSLHCLTPICDPECDHGTCTSPGVCSCDSGYAGDICNKPVCLEGCENGNCTEPGECNCFENYYGPLCQHNSLFCENENPCVNGGICTYLGNSQYTCDCPLGYNGTNCESSYNCSSSCENGGTCESGQFVCTCPMGYTGKTCGELVDNCVGQTCENGGTCINALNSFTCACTAGYTGDTCSTDLDLCASSPCQNGGTCIDYGDGYYCECPTSVYLDSPPPDCAGSPCLYHQCENGTCIVSNGEAACTCFSGYIGDFCQFKETTVEAGSASNPNSGLDQPGAIGVGVGVGVPLLVLVICVPLVCVCCCRRRYRKSVPESPPERVNNYIVEYTASVDENIAPEKMTKAAWVNVYPDLESEDSLHEDPSNIYDEVKEDLTSGTPEGCTSPVPAGYSVPTLPPQYRNSVSEALRALSLRSGTSSGTYTLERDVSPPPDYRNLTGPLHSAFSGSGEGVTRQGCVENAYDHPPVRFTRAEL